MPTSATSAAPPPTTHLLYLHGFRSSPQSMKARKVAERVARDHPGVVWYCPQLPPSPREALDGVRAATAHWPAARMAVVGSSLGGFYASAVAAERGCRVALINPAVQPARDLARYIGQQTQWHDPADSFFFQPRFIAELDAIGQATRQQEARATPETFALIAKGDEVLDWREMVARYPHARLRLLDGGDHAVSDFDAHIDALFDFLALAN
ncbi:MAG: YqiA/YcfP family alpha/beta fold hydrolase [Comamonas sp.]